MPGPRDLTAIIAAVEPALESLHESWRELIAEGRARRGGVLKGIAIAYGVVAVIGLVTQSIPVAVIGGLVTTVFGAAIYHAKVIAPVSEMETFMRGRALSIIVQAMEPAMSYSPNAGVSTQRFVQSGLFRSPDRYSNEDGLGGRIGDTDVIISEVHAEQKHETRDGKGNRRTHYSTIFRGVFMVADFHKHFQGTTRVLPDTAETIFGGLGKALQGFRPFSSQELVYLEDPEFERQFVVYSTDQVEARYILSTSMARRILDLRKRWDDDVRLSFVGSDVYVAIDHGGNLLEPKLEQGRLPRPEIARMVREVGVCFDLVDDLNLNTRIWTKE